MARMREALSGMVKKRDQLFDAVKAGAAIDWEGIVCGMINDAEDALSAPPRNCDVGTEREQHVRFTNYCNAHGDCVDCPIKAKWHTALSCGILWAQLPYEAKEEGAE